MRNSRRLITSVLTMLFSATAIADMPYLLPNVFDIGSRDYVTVQGSFSEEFFEPDTAMKADDYHVVSADGMKHALSPVYTRDLTIVEAPTPSAGTYRISTGVRTGRTAKAVWLDNDWKFLGRNETAPAGTKVYDVVSVTTAETYVSRGKTNMSALAPRKQGLEFVAVTHPSAIFVGEAAEFELHFNAKPLSGRTIQVYRGGMRYDERKLSAEVVSDSRGRFEIKADRPGVYVAMTRYRPPPAADASTGVSYTYSVVFEATQ